MRWPCLSEGFREHRILLRKSGSGFGDRRDTTPYIPHEAQGGDTVRGGACFRGAGPGMRAQTSARRSGQYRQATGSGRRGTSLWETFCSAYSPRIGGDNTGYVATSGPDCWASSRPRLIKRPVTRHPPPVFWITRTRLHFHHTGCRISGISDCWRIRLGRLEPRIRLPSGSHLAQVPAERPRREFASSIGPFLLQSESQGGRRKRRAPIR